METLSQNAALAVFVDMVPPTASHSGNRTAGATKHLPMRTAPAAATIRFGTVTENRLRRQAQTVVQFPDDKPPDVIGPTSTLIALEQSIYYARFAPDCSLPVARSRPYSGAQLVVYAQPVAHDKIDTLAVPVALDAPVILDAPVARDALDILVVTVSNKSVVCIDPSLVPSAIAPLAINVLGNRVMLGNPAMLGDRAMLGNRVMLGNPAMLGDCVMLGNLALLGDLASLLDQPSFARCNMLANVPVSYTHLTLPTIYSV